MGTQFTRQCVSRREVVATTQQQQLQQQQHQIVYSFVIILFRNHWIWWWWERKRSNGAAVVYRTQSELNATTNTFLLLLLIYCYAHQEYFLHFLYSFHRLDFSRARKIRYCWSTFGSFVWNFNFRAFIKSITIANTIEQPGCMFLFFANQLISSIPSCIAAV